MRNKDIFNLGLVMLLCMSIGATFQYNDVAWRIVILMIILVMPTYLLIKINYE